MRYYTYFPNDITNKDRALMNYWTPNNTNTDIPRLTATDVNDNDRFSDMYVENGTYFRLRNAQLGYTLPASLTQRIKLQKVRFYVRARTCLRYPVTRVWIRKWVSPALCLEV